MNKKHEIFFAIPFDAATYRLYESIRKTIRKKYPDVTVVIGNQEVGPSPEYSNFASFRAQNRELNRQFVARIRDADIVIADLTHNNPNVHVELGIALMQNKNVLRVTGRSVTDLAFDVRNLEVSPYKNRNELAKRILDYLDTFFKIKRLPMSPQPTPLYYEEAEVPIHLKATGDRQSVFETKSICPPNFQVRDGAVQVDFEILNAKTEKDWFGVYLRAGDDITMGSHLVYVRQCGSIEIAVYPGPRVIKTLTTGGPVAGRQSLTIEFENNLLEVQMRNVKLGTDKLSHQIPGRVLVAAWNANADVHSARMICRDTIEWDYELPSKF